MVAQNAALIDGKAIAARIKMDVAREVHKLREEGLPIRLVAVLAGQSPAARVYAENQARTCGELGIQYTLRELPQSVRQQELDGLLGDLARDTSVTGIMLHMPLPPQINSQQSQYAIDLLKDVEGVNPGNIGHVVYGHSIIAPCTALAVVTLIESTGIPLAGCEVAMVGASRITGKPTALLLSERGATVTLCDIHTRDLVAHTRRADVVVVAVGKPGLIDQRHIRHGAVVIDVGINRVASVDAQGRSGWRTVGDVDFDSVHPIAGWITPVPGGVGPMTVAMLLRNTVRAARLVYGLEKPFGEVTGVPAILP